MTKEIQVDETVQLSLTLEGSEWYRNDDIVSVSETGLVTGLKSDTQELQQKDGYTMVISHLQF